MSWVSILPGIAIAVIGLSATVASTWIKQRAINRGELIRDDIRTRETLYGEFIAECARLLVDAFQRTLEKPETLLPAYALINRIRLCASHEVLAAAEHLLERITDQYFSANLSIHELREMQSSTQPDPLQSFGEACRAELKTIRARI